MGFAAVKIIWISFLRSTKKKSMGMLWAGFNEIHNRWNCYKKSLSEMYPEE